MGPWPDDSRPGLDPPASDADATELERWTRLHEEVERLPVRKREMAGLVFYQRWPQVQVAEVFHVDVRTVRRWWESASVKLHQVLRQDVE